MTKSIVMLGMQNDEMAECNLTPSTVYLCAML